MALRKSAIASEEQLIARVCRMETSYSLSMELPLQDKPADEEIIISLVAEACWISRRHKKHLGRPMEIALIAAERFDESVNRNKFFGSVSLMKGNCGAYAYLPARSLFGIPTLIDLKTSFVHLYFERTQWGHGSLLSVSITNRDQLFALPGFPGPELVGG